MSLDKILITGGCGFAGSVIALHFREKLPKAQIVALDNFHRRGSELNAARLREAGVEVLRGDVRMKEDFPETLVTDLLIECSAEPSVLAGYGGSPEYLIETNLNGAINCLEYCRKQKAAMIFLSTSRVYGVGQLCELVLEKSGNRFVINVAGGETGVSEAGIAENFSTAAPRSLYGTTKLAAEMFIEEYVNAYGLCAVINRCGVLAGPWQMGKADQGIFTYWMAAHHFNKPLKYIGFGGYQVRDLLDARDLAELVFEQAANREAWGVGPYNVGGGTECSLSLLETTKLCQVITGNEIAVGVDRAMRPMDIPWYVSDCRKLFAKTGWRPRHDAEKILADTHQWIQQYESRLADKFFI
jgi:CDP-paratose 2-epimerase